MSQATDQTLELRNVIGGAPAPRRGRPHDAPSIDPSTGQEYARAPLSRGRRTSTPPTPRPRTRSPRWGRTTPAERQLALLRLADAIEQRADEFVAVESRNTGKPLHLTATDEVPPCVDQLRFFAGAARVLDGLSAGEYMAGHTSWVRREPVGVVGQVTPWNYPLMMAIWKIAPGARGRATRSCSSRRTPRRPRRCCSAQVADEVLPAGRAQRRLRRPRHRPRARLPPAPGHGRDHRVGARRARRWRRRPRPTSSACTSSSAARRRSSCSPTPTSPRPPRASPAPGYYNAGQDCTAATRVLVHASVHDDFVAALAEAAEGPAHRRAGRPRRRVRPGQQRAPARARHRVPRPAARPRVDRRRRAPRRRRRATSSRPTVVDGLRQDDEAVQDEIFGPVITVQTFTDEDEAIALANGVRYGLSSSVWTHEPRPGAARCRGRWTSGWCGSTPTSRSSPRCRTAGSSTPGTARTCRCTGSRTTPASST